MAEEDVSPTGGALKSTEDEAQESAKQKIDQESVMEFIANQRLMNDKLIKLFESFSKRNSNEDESGGMPPPSKKRKENDDAIELHPSDNALTRTEQEEEEDDDDDAWDGFNGFGQCPTNHKGDGPDAEHGTEEHISGSQFQGLLEQSEDVLGDPIETALAEVCNKTWGKAKLSKDKKKALREEFNIPSNCPNMKTPKLNTEIDIRLYDQARTKDQAAADRQKDMVRAAIPLYHAVGAVAKLKSELSKHHAPSAVLDSVGMINVTIQKSIRMLNYSYTETTRKRKYDVTGTLGGQFKPFAQAESTEESLFSAETIKAMMKAELSKVTVKKQDSSYSQTSKNGSGLQKSQRGEYSGGYTKKNFPKPSQNYNNYNNNRGGSNKNNNNGNNNNNNNNNSRWPKNKKN